MVLIQQFLRVLLEKGLLLLLYEIFDVESSNQLLELFSHERLRTVIMLLTEPGIHDRIWRALRVLSVLGVKNVPKGSFLARWSVLQLCLRSERVVHRQGVRHLLI